MLNKQIKQISVVFILLLLTNCAGKKPMSGGGGGGGGPMRNSDNNRPGAGDPELDGKGDLAPFPNSGLSEGDTVVGPEQQGDIFVPVPQEPSNLSSIPGNDNLPAIGNVKPGSNQSPGGKDIALFGAQPNPQEESQSEEGQQSSPTSRNDNQASLTQTSH